MVDPQYMYVCMRVSGEQHTHIRHKLPKLFGSKHYYRFTWQSVFFLWRSMIDVASIFSKVVSFRFRYIDIIIAMWKW